MFELGRFLLNEHNSLMAHACEERVVSNFEQNVYMWSIACQLLGPVLGPKLKIGF